MKNVSKDITGLLEFLLTQLKHVEVCHYKITNKIYYQCLVVFLIQECNCDNKYSTGNCAQSTGQCECKPQYSGKTCEYCAEGYTDWPLCTACICNNIGSIGGTCYPPCRCKFGYLGPNCSECVDGYYGFPNCKRILYYYL